MAKDERNLVLIGFMGAGKTTVGRICAARGGLNFQDSDALIEARARCSIRQLFTTCGEAAFRKLEKEVIKELAAGKGQVIATGGGAVLDGESALRLRENGFVVLLSATSEIILRRVSGGVTRPLLASAGQQDNELDNQIDREKARIEALLEEREAIYRAVAHCRIDTSDRPPVEVATSILTLYATTATPSDRSLLRCMESES